MTWIGDGARGGDWCGMPLLVQVELAPSVFWLDPAFVVDTLLLAACCNSTSGISLNAMCSRSSKIAGRCWVGGCFWLVEGCE
jgi:hypothetical protein